MAEIRKLKIGKQVREFQIHRQSDINQDKRTVALSFSSEDPVERWFGMEILDHSTEKSVDLKRLKRGGALLIDHDTGNQVGVIEEVLIDTADRKGRAVVRFGRSAKAEEIFQDVLDEIRSNVSVGYMIDDLVLEEEKKGKPPVYRATKWTPYEISLVSVPADITVGVGRSDDAEGSREFEIEIPSVIEGQKKQEEEKKMEDKKEVDVKAVANEARETELARVREIRAMGKAHKCEDIADKFIDENRSVSDMKDEVLKRITEKPAIDTTVGIMSKKEAKLYSYARAMAAAAGLAVDDSKNSLELEVSGEIRKRMPKNHMDHGGIYIPLSKRAGLYDSAGVGAELVYTEYGGELIEMLRKRTVCAALGARIRTGLSSPISFPRKTSEGAAAWVAENPGSDQAGTDDAYETVTLTPKSLIRSSSISRQLIVQSVIDAEADIRDSLANAIALAVDKAGLHGTGANNQPTGAYVASNVNSKAMGGIPTFGKLIDMITEVAKDNAILGTLGWVTTPGMAGKMMQTLVASAAGSAMIWQGKIEEGTMCGYRAIASNQVRSDLVGGAEHGLVFANWLDLLIGMFGGVEITVDPYSLKKQAMIEYTMFAMADVMLRHPESFCKATGATIV